MKKIIVGLLCGMLAIGTFAGCGTETPKEENKKVTNDLNLSAEDDGYDKIDWSKDEPYCHVPDPNTEKVNILSEDSYSVRVVIHNVSQSGFKKYVDLCKEMGYTVDAYYETTEFMADNENGYSIQLYYLTKEEYSGQSEWTDDMDKSIGMEIYIPDEEDKKDDESSENKTSQADQSDATSTTDTQSSSNTSSNINVNNIRPQVKEFLDSYEAFIKEYCDFMKQYDEADDISPLLDQYGEMMKKYADLENKFDNLDTSDYNDDELQYYMDVQDRTLDMILDV